LKIWMWLVIFVVIVAFGALRSVLKDRKNKGVEDKTTT